jgi:hypothetical protein
MGVTVGGPITWKRYVVMLLLLLLLLLMNLDVLDVDCSGVGGLR